MRRSFVVGIMLLASMMPATAASFTSLVTWGAVTGATSYVVERNTNGGAFTQVGTPTTNSFTESGLGLGTTYCYHVAAVNAVGQSAFSSPDTCGTTGAPPAVPGAVQVIFTFVP